jgi:hypothetical protein
MPRKTIWGNLAYQSIKHLVAGNLYLALTIHKAIFPTNFSAASRGLPSRIGCLAWSRLLTRSFNRYNLNKLSPASGIQDAVPSS